MPKFINLKLGDGFMALGFPHQYTYIYILVGGFNPSEKYYSWDDYSQYMEKMFQTTNQYMYPII
jgi:hypothetical protein